MCTTHQRFSVPHQVMCMHEIYWTSEIRDADILRVQRFGFSMKKKIERCLFSQEGCHAECGICCKNWNVEEMKRSCIGKNDVGGVHRWSQGFSAALSLIRRQMHFLFEEAGDIEEA